ncbi:Reverse transcriptase domain [Arabidopsis thaliana x Arabidopsis arenosa]|uniref:Reverse transcriptase domain n=1 Tax=Arabidopsis thaliana x Arabidopsis arenosa TaxID=1240361 RepID=A0A8T2BDY5_9BRAS|nr:Reverse transcriptase domain [Arabidopsis thaliana x Arabidopsis arenosa]
MPPICGHCKEIGHNVKHCRSAPVSCSSCKSTAHSSDKCPRIKKKKQLVYRVKQVPVSAPLGESAPSSKSVPSSLVQGTISQVKSDFPTQRIIGESSRSRGSSISAGVSEADPDSSDIVSSESEDFDALEEEECHELDSQMWCLSGSAKVDEARASKLINIYQAKSAKFISALMPGWFCDDNYGFSELGKIWVLWHPSVKLTIISKSLQCITCEVILPKVVCPVVVSFVYASNVEAERCLLWDELVSLSTNTSVVGRPWTVLGDFNQTLNPEDHSISDGFSVDRATLQFRDCLLNASLLDLTFRGCTFTWWNKRKADPIAKKLDRVLVNDTWSVQFPLAFGYFGEPDFSDHSVSSLSLDLPMPFHKKSFKFYNYLLQSQEFLDLIGQSWFSLNLVGSDMFRVSKKLCSLKKIIRDFSRSNFSGIEQRVKDAHEEMIKCQCVMLSSPSVLNANIVVEAEKKWQVLALAEESFFRQRSSISWLSGGDSNSSYFHRMVNSRMAANHIHFLEDGDGIRVEFAQGIQNICVDYFEKLLGSEVSPPLFTQDDISHLLDFRCSDAQKYSMAAAFSSQEIKDAFCSLPKNKTSGPDGYPAEFFISCWNIVGGEVISEVKEFFSSGKLLKQWNATTLFLIPKVSNASSPTQFRPISCLNTLYKVISKLLANRLKSLLPDIISPSQSAFIPGRLLSENVLLATEIVHGYNRNNIAPSGMLKVDLHKAFDSVRWDFVIAALKGLNLSDVFINWITECITSPTFSISVNGVSGGFFKSKRGLRQGDPLSPYLFVLSMEVFSKLLRSRYSSGYIFYHPKTSGLEISHLMFADDVMIFFDGGSSSLHGINETLDDFASWSGLVMNREKTELFLAGVNETESATIANYGFPHASLPIRYLGLPLMCRKLTVSEYAPLVNKIKGKFNSWAVKSLSYAGRLQLIATVITGTVVFWISTFKIPRGCIREIESLCSRFLWSGGTENSHKANVAWSKVCLPKSEGGLGLRRFTEWNTTLSLKLIWLLFSNSGSLWVAWHRYHHLHLHLAGGNSISNFWEIKEKVNDTWNWKCLLRLRPLAEKFLRCTVGNGRTASFWWDNWTSYGPLIKFLGEAGPRNLRIPLTARVADAINGEVWSLPAPRSQNSLDLHTYLTTLSLPLQDQEEDEYWWCVNGLDCNGFSSSRTWQVLRQRDSEKAWSSSVWFKGATPRKSFHMWIAHLDRLPTRTRLISWGMQISHLCCLCSSAPETRDHLLLSCDYTGVLWVLALSRLRLQPALFLNWDSLFIWTRGRSASAPSILRKLVTQAIVYATWKQRNNVLHNSQVIPPSIIFRAVDREIINSINARRHRKTFRNLMRHWIS